MSHEEENKLEEILRLAANEPAHRPEFYSILLDSTVYIIGTTGVRDGETCEVTLDKGHQIHIHTWEREDGSSVIPFFTSLKTLQNSIDEELPYLALPARALFEITLGATLFLNPMSDYGKEFIPAVIEQLLSTGLSYETVQRVTEKKTNVLLGQPAHYPSQMVDSLTQLLAKHKNVKRAFLALMHDTSLDEKPHLLVGIEAEGDIEPILKEAGNVAGDTAPEGEAVDLYRVSEDDNGISQYLIHETEPFYERKWGAKLRSFFNRGTA